MRSDYDIGEFRRNMLRVARGGLPLRLENGLRAYLQLLFSSLINGGRR